jgi:hypothetical protein
VQRAVWFDGHCSYCSYMFVHGQIVLVERNGGNHNGSAAGTASDSLRKVDPVEWFEGKPGRPCGRAGWRRSPYSTIHVLTPEGAVVHRVSDVLITPTCRH